MTSKKILNYISLFVAMLLWGGSFVLTKHLLEDFGPITIIFTRLLISSLIFVTLSLILFGKKFFLPKSDLILLLCLAFFEPIVYFLFETYSLKFTDPSIVSVIIATIPIFVAFIAVYFLKEIFSKTNFAGVFISLIGIVIMLFPTFANSSVSIVGVLLAFGAVLSTIGYNFFLKKLSHAHSPILIITWQNLIGLMAFTPLFFLMNTEAEIIQQWNSLAKIGNISSLLILAVFCSSIAFMLYLKGLRSIGIGKANTFTNLIPVVTALLSFFLFNEVVTWYKILGILIVIAGVFLVQIKPKLVKS